MDSPTAESSVKSLEKFCKNYTKLAAAGKLDPVIGRDEEIRRTMQVLSRRTKNNPMLIGEPRRRKDCDCRRFGSKNHSKGCARFS